MARDFTSANVRTITARVERIAFSRAKVGLTAAALAGERIGKKQAVTGGTHRQGTPTPATRNSSGPALITGNLRRSVTHTPAKRSGSTLRARVGVAQSAPYGRHLERLGFRFMKPTAVELRTKVAPLIVAALRSGRWQV